MTIDKIGNPKLHQIKRAFLFLLIFTLLLLVFAPWSFRMPGGGLEASWVAVLNEAFAKDWKWGKEISFTYGPYGFLILRQFHPGTWLFQFIFWLIVLSGLSLNLFKRFSHLPSILTIILAGLFALTVLYSGNTFFYCIPLIVALNFESNENQRKNLDIYFLVILSGLGALIKFSFAPFPFVIYFLMDAYFFFKKGKIPFLTVLFIGTIIIAFFALNLSFKDLLTHLSLSNAFSNSYGTAMQLNGPWAEIIEFSIASLIILASWALLNGKYFFSFKSLIIFSSLFFCLLIAQKASFVRHDSHGLISWNVFLICSLFYLAYIWKNFRGKLVRSYICILVVMSFFLFLKWYKFYWGSSYFQIALSTPYNSLLGNLKQLSVFAADPTQYINESTKDYENTLKQIEKNSDLPELDGSVDIIPSNQIELIAKNMNYHPRPIFQSYAAHAPQLIKTNRSFFDSKNGPTNIIFGLDDIDGRYPGSSEGGSWIEFFKHYDPITTVNTNLLLKRRAADRKVDLNPIGTFTLSFGETFDLAKYNSSHLWAVIEFDETLLGSAVGFFFKEPIIFVRTLLDNNRWGRFRIIPSISKEGQLVSPLIKNALDFAGLYLENDSGWGERVKSLRFQTSDFGKRLYSKIIIKLYSLNLTKNFENDSESFLTNSLYSRKIFRSLKPIKGMLEIQTLNNKQIAFAHAPSDLELWIPRGMKKIKIGFGIVKGAWDGKGMSDGVCFKISYLSGQKNELLNECLDPKLNANAREEKLLEIDLPRTEEKLMFSTECKGNCYWDWSYWTDPLFINGAFH